MLPLHQSPISQVIAAEGEQKASRALREAAEVISESPSALQVRRSLKCERLINKHVTAEISSNPEQHLRRAQLHHHISNADQHFGAFHVEGK